MPLCALLEIFHPDESVGYQHLTDNPHGSQFIQLANSYTRKAKEDNITQFLADLKEACHSDYLTFKIFPRHLPPRALEIVIASSSALLVHTRNRLQTFISNSIAGDLKKWGGVDTSRSLITFNERDFRQYVATIQDFLSTSVLHAMDHHVPVLFSSFEELNTYQNPDLQLLHVAGLFSHVSGCALEPISPPRDLPRKQDTRTLAHSKVSNSDEMLGFLVEIGAQDLNDNSKDIPYSRYQDLS